MTLDETYLLQQNYRKEIICQYHQLSKIFAEMNAPQKAAEAASQLAIFERGETEYSLFHLEYLYNHLNACLKYYTEA